MVFGHKRLGPAAQGIQVVSATDRQSRKKMQPGRCSICTHADRVQIERLACEGAALDKIAKTFPGITRFSIKRHLANHVSDKRKGELLAGSGEIDDLIKGALKEDRKLLDYFRLTRGIIAKRMLACAEASDTHGVNLMIARMHENLIGIGRLTGEIGQLGVTLNQTNNTIVNNFETSPAFIRIVEVVLEQLRDYPELRANVARAVREIGDATPTHEPLMLEELAHVE
jgi:hypothetical protein